MVVNFKIMRRLEYYKWNEISQNQENFNEIITSLHQIKKTNEGYSIYRFDKDYKWFVKITINGNQIEIKQSI